MDKHIQEQMQRYDCIYKKMDDFYKRAAQWAGLSDAAHWVLYQLCGDKKEVIQSDLCKEWYFSKQTINSAVTKLKSIGYIELRPVSGKGNRKCIALTSEGSIFSKKYILPILKAEQKSFEVLTEEERETMIRLMKKQLDTMNRETENLWQ